jgi:hypothetical protein
MRKLLKSHILLYVIANQSKRPVLASSVAAVCRHFMAEWTLVAVAQRTAYSCTALYESRRLCFALRAVFTLFTIGHRALLWVLVVVGRFAKRMAVGQTLVLMPHVRKEFVKVCTAALR